MAQFPVGSYIWIPDEDEVVIAAKVESTFSPGTAGKVSTLDGKSINLKAGETKEVKAMNPQCLEGVDDMVNFKELDEFSILNNLRSRYYDDIIYTNIGKILTSVNPFKMLPIYDPMVMDEYIEKGSSRMPPHVYGVSDDAFNAMIDFKANQSCIVSGESGAGKTEATKVFLSYISEKSKRMNSTSSSAGAGVEIQQKILETNPLLEAFGNAKTTRNDNSSRFGKWIKVQMDNTKGTIVGGSLTSYLLEKSRLVYQAEEERNYHIFYQICAAAESDPEFEEYGLAEATQYYYLNQSSEPCTVVEGMDDIAEFNSTWNAMDAIGITPEEKKHIITVLVVVLGLGNIEFEGGDKSKVAASSKGTLEDTAKHFGCSPAELEKCMVKIYRGNPKEEDLVGDNNLATARDSRDGFAKHIYSALFDWLITKVNVALGNAKDSPSISSIGVLDIFGFESFQLNSFEQLCINYTNERLQGHFNSHIFKLEQEQYKKEGIDVSKIDFKDNLDVIETIDKSKTGILQIVADSLKLKTATDETILNNLKKAADESSAGILTYPSAKEAKKDPSLGQSFQVMHYAGPVIYNIDRFLEKNRDQVPVLVERLGLASKNAFIKQLFQSKTKTSSKGARKVVALGIQFAGQLNDLMGELNATQPHFIRCVKPNSQKERDIFDAHMVLEQLTYAGLLEVCKIRQMGYPIRRDFVEFHQRYKAIADQATADYTALIKALVSAGVMKDSRFQVGNSKVFLKDDQAQSLEDARGVALTKYVTAIQRCVRGFVVRRKHKKFKTYIENMKKAVKAKDKALLKNAILDFGQLPYGGKHLSSYREGIDQLNRIEDEERMTKLIEDAMATRDINQIKAALEAAAQKQMSGTKAAKEAESLLKTIESEIACIKHLREAIEANDEGKLQTAVAEAKKLNIQDCEEARDAQVAIDAIQKEKQTVAALDKAVKSSNIADMKKYMNQMADIGKKDHPLVKEAEAKVKEDAKMQAKIAAEKEGVLFQLKKAMDERNLALINELEQSVIKLGIQADNVVARSRQIRAELEKEKEMLQKLNAETTAANAKAQTKVGLVPDDVVKIKALIKEAEGMISSDDDTIVSAKDELSRLEKQLEVQKMNDKTLTEYKGLRENLNAEKDPAKRKVAADKLFKVLKKMDMMNQEFGVNTSSAVEVRDRLKQLQLEIDEREKEANEKARKEAQERMKNATEDDLEEEEARRMQHIAEINELFSPKHKELLAEASNPSYHFAKYSRIREDADFVRNIPAEYRERVSASKLHFNKKPLTRSLCVLEEDQNHTALRINRAILQYCGDSSSSFPATMAQFVLIRGLEDPTITDEIYLQLIKHMNGNPKSDSENRAWLLMCLATKNFPPTAEFAPFLLNYFINHRNKKGLIGNYSRLCIVQLDATIELGPTWFKPNLEEIQSYRKRPPVLATIHTLDGRPIDYPVTPEMAVHQVLDLIKRKEKIEDDVERPEWGIYVLAEDVVENETPRDRLIRFYKHYNPAKLAHIDMFLDHWKSNPEELFEKLTIKYGPEPAKDAKTQKKGRLAMPITAAMQAVKFLGIGSNKGTPPAPQIPWALPWWTHLGDVVFRMTKQNKNPRFVFKRRVLHKSATTDKWHFYQCQEDIRLGYMPMLDPNKVAILAGLSMKHLCLRDSKALPSSGAGLIDLGLKDYISEAALENKSIEDYATLTLNILNTQLNKVTDVNKVYEEYVDMCKTHPIYGMNLFYVRHDLSQKNYVIGVDTNGIHVVDEARSKVTRSFDYSVIRKFGATAEYFWMNVESTKQSSGWIMNTNSGINVLMYTLQSWEMYDTVYDATHTFHA
mmetsp:Transcript_16018/g.18722  ORF Transcript_16018/g.18722 Transcript_16018/m.18722 type:complete len:1812 (+) Transcript_16018:270-5705(+)